ncbi:hypothetical protein A3197_18765 [Candidatus Thiodiazotropha endoloripes]|nr:hypothetical protein A3197_18765 [Candidatus Thiodiazotropha endoloripes]
MQDFGYNSVVQQPVFLCSDRREIGQKKNIRRERMPKLTSGLTQKERLQVLHSIESIKSNNNKRERKILQMYKDWIARECFISQLPE